jgi:pimeloyl-ACP methyl ester carboxylesterase
MTTATVVLVHGSCSTPGAWNRVTPLLDTAGVSNIAVQLPSCLPESDMNDADFVRSVLDACGDPVVLVGHSYGGMVLTEVGAHPSVKRLVYLDATMSDVGEDMYELLAGKVAEGLVETMRVDEDTSEFDADVLTAYVRSRGWSADDAAEFVSELRPQRAAASVLKATVAAWRTVPATFISCADSEIGGDLPALFASRASDVIALPGDHFPNFRQPAEVADIITRIARNAAELTYRRRRRPPLRAARRASRTTSTSITACSGMPRAPFRSRSAWKSASNA